MRRSISLAAFAAFAVTACSDGTGVSDPSRSAPLLQRATNLRAGAVYTMTNAAGGNEVLAFDRSPDGSLSPAGAFATGGSGSGSTLANAQGALVLSGQQNLLFAVNAGSDQVSVLAVENDGLRLVDIEPSGGDMPISVAVHGRLVYVLNNASGSISGFTVDGKGDLTPIAGSSRTVTGGAAAAPAQVEFSPDGAILVVTGKATNVIDTYVVGGDGLVAGPRANPSSGATPFGFAFDQHGTLVVSEAFGGAPNQGAVSSYRADGDVGLTTVSGTVRDNQAAPCWIVITDNGRFVYTTNTASGSISSYLLRRDGTLTLLESVAGTTNGGPTDAALSRGSRYLYALVPGTGAIAAFAVGEDGGLAAIGTTAVPPLSTSGLAAR